MGKPTSFFPKSRLPLQELCNGSDVPKFHTFELSPNRKCPIPLRPVHNQEMKISLLTNHSSPFGNSPTAHQSVGWLKTDGLERKCFCLVLSHILTSQIFSCKIYSKFCARTAISDTQQWIMTPLYLNYDIVEHRIAENSIRHHKLSL